jgi:hypothetical protein
LAGNLAHLCFKLPVDRRVFNLGNSIDPAIKHGEFRPPAPAKARA